MAFKFVDFTNPAPIAINLWRIALNLSLVPLCLTRETAH